MTVTSTRGILLAAPRLFERMRRRMEQVTARLHVRELDERMLRDIGVTRTQIELREFMK